jgi:hypothetical protein
VNLTHDEVQDLLGAYALDAVEGDEADAVELHLRDCARCRAEVETHRQTAAFLSYTGEAAPPVVWDRIAQALEETPGTDVPRLLPFAGRGTATRSRRWPQWAAASVAAAVIALLGVVVVQQGREIDRIRVAQQTPDPRAREIQLTAASGGDVLARAVMLPDGSGYLIAGDLPALPNHLTYQLWGVIGDRTVSLGVLGARPHVVPFSTDPSVGALAVTAERQGGVVASKNQPVVSGRVEPAV